MSCWLDDDKDADERTAATKDLRSSSSVSRENAELDQKQVNNGSRIQVSQDPVMLHARWFGREDTIVLVMSGQKVSR